MRFRVAQMLILALIGLMAGCSGEDDGSSVSTPATVTTTPEQGAAAFCAARDEFQRKVRALGPQPEINPPLSAADQQALDSYNAELKTLSEELRAAAPAAIRDVVDAIDPSDDSPDPSQQEAIRVYGDYVTRECPEAPTP
jgi:hypothetical protein